MLSKSIKYELVNRAVSRAKSGLYFLEECLSLIHRGGTDAAFSRSCYILISYNFELILKAWLVLNRSGNSKAELLKELNSHNLEKLSLELPPDSLLKIGIKKIRKDTDNGFIIYVVEASNGRNIAIQDFVDVRYDFEKDNLRKIDQEESKIMREGVAFLLEVGKMIITQNETQN